MKTTTPMARPQRRDRALHERIHDPYRMRDKPAGPVVCPTCGAFYTKGRWQWPRQAVNGAHTHPCPACQRIRDGMPAGHLTIEGWFVAPHKDEIIGLVRRCESDEASTHPLHRIIAVREEGMHLEVTTTDIHLPRRIGEALARAYDGHLSYRYPAEEYALRVTWRRDD
ncbi:BCAM0308 family protein [Novispirillum sp. DQ9]|uniref:BCAM0308 family protein n=1 Tax=Novispirillum sp. DQ9 TaxID=3398612 RepID=UPI003C7E5E8B